MITNKFTQSLLATVVIGCLCLSAAPPKQGPKVYYVEITTKFGAMKLRLYNETPLHRDNFLKLISNKFYDSLTFHRVIPEFVAQGGDYKSKYATKDSVIGDGDLGYKIPQEIRPNLIHKRGAIAAARDNNPEMASNASQFYLVQGRRFTYDELIKVENLKNQRIKSDMLFKVTQSDSVKARLQDFTLRGDKEGMKKYLADLQPEVDKAFEKRGWYKFTEQQIQEYTSVGGIPQLDSGYTVFGEIISGIHVLDSICAQPRAKNDRPNTDIRMKIRVVKN